MNIQFSDVYNKLDDNDKKIARFIKRNIDKPNIFYFLQSKVSRNCVDRDVCLYILMNNKLVNIVDFATKVAPEHFKTSKNIHRFDMRVKCLGMLVSAFVVYSLLEGLFGQQMYSYKSAEFITCL